MIVEQHVRDYLESINPAEDSIINDLLDEARDNHVPIIRSDVREFLRFVIRSRKPIKILEIGTAIGYSAIVMARECESGTVIDTIERNDNRYERAIDNVAKAGLANVINIHHGDALDILDKFEPSSYDMIFMDAAKGQYREFYDKAMPLLKQDGLMICDNVLQDGALAFPAETVIRRDHTVHRRMREFLYDIKSDKSLNSTVLTIGDGVLLVERRG